MIRKELRVSEHEVKEKGIEDEVGVEVEVEKQMDAAD